MPKRISESCELVNLCDVNCSSPIFFWDTLYIWYTILYVYVRRRQSLCPLLHIWATCWSPAAVSEAGRMKQSAMRSGSSVAAVRLCVYVCVRAVCLIACWGWLLQMLLMSTWLVFPLQWYRRRVLSCHAADVVVSCSQTDWLSTLVGDVRRHARVVRQALVRPCDQVGRRGRLPERDAGVRRRL